MFRNRRPMPQLDTLTYFSQYAYLMISFLGTYVLTLNFILPGLTALTKLRQKLNSLSTLASDLDAPGDGSQGPTEAVPTSRLAAGSWYDAVQKSSRRPWPMSCATMMVAATVRTRKLLTHHVVLPYGR